MGNYQSGDNTIQGERLSRREAVFDKMDDDSFALFYAGRRKYSSGESLFPFAVNKDFYYLTGIEQEGSSLLLSKRGGECREFLFIDPYEESKRRFYGKKLSIDEAKRLTGIPNVLLSTYLTSRLDRLLRQGLDGEEPVKKGYFDYSPELKIGPELDVKTFVNSLKVVYPDLHDLDARPLVMPLRKCKSDSEVEEIKKAAGYAKEGLLSAYSVLRPGAYLYDLGLFYEHAANSASSCSGLSHLPHIASGEEACYRDPFPGQKQAKEGEIVFITVSKDYALEGYDVHALHYLVKPLEPERFAAVLDDVAGKLEGRRARSVVVATAQGVRRLALDDILYAERAGRRVRYHCEVGDVDSQTIRTSFSAAMEPLLQDARFLLCGASFAVNLARIAAVEGQRAVFDTGASVALPRAAVPALKVAWGSFWLAR